MKNAAGTARARLVLVHGWGLHAGVWDDLVAKLDGDHETSALDLPGHGGHRNIPQDYRLETLAAALVARITSPAVWLGWSLGGMVALTIAARYPQKVSALVLVGGTPRFVNGDGWDRGLPAAELDAFAASLLTDYPGTLQRFLSLQVTRDDRGRDTLRRLRGQLSRRQQPFAEALAGGLEILRRTDLRPAVEGIRVPVLLIHGARDRLVPPGAARYLAGAMPAASLEMIAGAGHAPFLSHPAVFMRLLRQFLACNERLEAVS